MTRPPPRRPAAGQAMVELVVGIVCLLILVLGATTLARLAHRQIRLRHDVRAEAGRDALQQMFDSCFDKQNTSI